MTSADSSTVPLPVTLLWLHQTWSCDQLSDSKLSAKPLSSNLLLASFYMDQFQLLGEASPNLWQTHSLSNGNYISADLQILPICAASHWKSHRVVCQIWGDEKLLILA